jgi:AhpD family alkylhydroperoxidase
MLIELNKDRMIYMNEVRIDLSHAAPKISESVIKLDDLVSEYVASAGITIGFAHLLRLRASQINQCAYCVRLHTQDSLASGESVGRVSLLTAWRESEYFTEKERAALALIEAVTLISVGQIPRNVYAKAKEVLTNEEILAVEWTGVIINVWNRIAIASRLAVRP